MPTNRHTTDQTGLSSIRLRTRERSKAGNRFLTASEHHPTADDGFLVVSGFETLEEDSGVVNRIQLYEFFDASNNLRAKRVLPMRFALIDKSKFAELADAAEFVPVALYGDYDRGEYLEDSSPHMIWILEKARRP